MPIVPSWSDIALRLLLTVIAGGLIGFDRGEHGRPAGLRTTLLVCLAASVSMIQVNLLLGLAGKAKDSFVMLDLMRLPLGILSGMGFIGGGAILRRDNLVLGVTTAATLWFVTVIGLCFGGGQLALGVIALALGMVVLTLLKWLELGIPQDRRGTLVLGTGSGGPTVQDIRRNVLARGIAIVNMGITFDHAAARSEFRLDIRWRARPEQHDPPAFLESLSQLPGVTRLEWCPQGSSTGTG